MLFTIKKRLLIFGILTLNACSANYLEMGKQSMSQGEYEDAMYLFSLAQKEEPNPEAQNLHSSSKKAAIEQNLNAAQQAYSDLKYEEALSYLASAKTLDPNASTTIDASTIRQKQKDLQQDFNAAEKLVSQYQWDAALAAYNRLLPYKNLFPDLPQRIEKTQQEKSLDLSLVGHEHLNNGEISQAKQNFEQAKALWKLNPKAAQGLQYLEEDSLIDELTKKSQHALKREDFPTAYNKSSDALKLRPNNKNLQEVFDTTKTQWTSSLINKASEAQLDGDVSSLEKAISFLEMGQKLKPNLSLINKKLKEAKRDLAEVLFNQAKDLKHQETKAGQYFLNLLRVVTLVPNYPEAQVKLDEARKILRARRQYFVSVKATDFPGLDDGYAHVLAQDALTTLRNSNIPDLNVVHREDLESKTQEQVYSQIFGGNFKLDIKPANIQLVVKVIEKKTRKSGYNKPLAMRSRYKAGTRMVPNPEYPRAQSRVNEQRRAIQSALQQQNSAEQSYVRAQQELDSLIASGATQNQISFKQQSLSLAQLNKTIYQGTVSSAQRNLAQAESDLLQTPQQIEEDVILDYNYNNYSISSQANIKLGYQIVDNQTSLFQDAGEVEHSLNDSDSFTQGVKASDVTGLYEDPDNLQDPQVLLESCKQESSLKLQTKIVEAFKKYAHKYYQMAKEAKRLNKIPEAIEHSVDYLYATSTLEDEQAWEADKILKSNAGFSFEKPVSSLIPLTSDTPTLGMQLDETTTSGSRGVKAISVVPASLAQKAGIQIGDEIFAVDLIPVNDHVTLINYIRQQAYGSSLVLQLKRGLDIHWVRIELKR